MSRQKKTVSRLVQLSLASLAAPSFTSSLASFPSVPGVLAAAGDLPLFWGFGNLAADSVLQQAGSSDDVEVVEVDGNEASGAKDHETIDLVSSDEAEDNQGDAVMHVSCSLNSRNPLSRRLSKWIKSRPFTAKRKNAFFHPTH
jgi:hypothetical protein